MPNEKSRDIFSRPLDWWESICNKFPILNIINFPIVVVFLFASALFIFFDQIPCAIASAIIDALSISSSAKHRAKKVAHSVILALTIAGLIVGICIKCAPAEPRHTSSPQHTTVSSSVSSHSGSSPHSSSGGSVYKASATTRPTRTPTPTPTRVVYTPTPSAEDAEIIVYVTEYGSKYHRRSCGSLWNSCYEITLSKAIANGYTPCKKCNPPK